MVAEIFAEVTPVTVPNCDPSEFLRMNWVPATVPPYVHDALMLVVPGIYAMDPATGVERAVNDWVVVFVLLGAPVPALFWMENV
jgi:hypothetical protein